MSRLQFDGFFQKPRAIRPMPINPFGRERFWHDLQFSTHQHSNWPWQNRRCRSCLALESCSTSNPKWPRRLVYCLPMRTLVEQTEREVRTWICASPAKHTKPRDGSELRWLALHSPIILMGGEDTGDWDIHPERPAILIGTQDMLLSRALNRGYGMSRYRWPMHFGLLNNDCMWVLDETQLMGVGVETSAQLDGFRNLAQWANDQNCRTWWMSATMDEDRFATVDHRSLRVVGIRSNSATPSVQPTEFVNDLKPRSQLQRRVWC